MPPKLHVLYIASLLILSFAMLCLSYERNRIWESPDTLANDIIQKSPRKPRAYNNLGYYYFKKGMLCDALNVFRISLVWNPRYAKGYCNVAAVYLRKEAFDDAISYLTRAIELDPKLGMAHFNLGLAYEAKGRQELALEHFGKALALGNEDARAGMGRLSRKAASQ